MNANKPNMPGRGGGRGASFTAGRGGMALRGHGSRGNFGNRRGGRPYPGSFQGMRGPGQGHPNAGRNRHEPAKDGTTSGYGSVGKRDENRRTLTDFKIIGLEIPDLAWQWGIVPTLKIESQDDKPAEEEAPTTETSSPPSRIRIYFHTPVTPDDSHPIPLSTIPSDSRKGKRKKLEDDDAEDGARERPPPQMSDELSSVAPSVSESVGDDWLMAAIAESEKTESEHEHEHCDVEDGDPQAESAPAPDNTSEGIVEDFLNDGNDVSEEHNISESIEAVEPSAHLNGVPISVSEAIAPPDPDDAEPKAVEADSSSHLPEISASSAADLKEPFAVVVDKTSADFVGSESQVPLLETTPEPDPEAATSTDTEGISRQATLLDINTTTDSALDSSELIPTQVDSEDHLPEPPTSTSSVSAYGDSKTDTRIPSANRLSVSYAGGERRLVIDAQIVESLKVFREKGRIEIRMSVSGEDIEDLKGILVEGLPAVTKSYTRLESISGLAESDPTVPPFAKLSLPSTITLTAYLDTSKPLSEPRWVKTGDTAEWLRSILGRMFWAAGDAAEGWEKRIVVDDPDPPPTIWTVLEGWATSSPIGTAVERQRFLKTHMTETDNILEILLRLVRGDRATPFSQNQSQSQVFPLSNISGPLLSALSPGSAHGSQQTHVSLAVLAIFRMTVEYAKKAVGDSGKIEVEERVGDVIRCIPSHLIHKSVDGIFKEWKLDAKGR